VARSRIHREFNLLGSECEFVQGFFARRGGAQIVCRIAGTVGEISGIGGAIYDFASPRFRSRHCRCHRRRPHAVRSRSLPVQGGSTRCLMPCSGSTTANIPGARGVDEGGEEGTQHHHRRDVGFPGETEADFAATRTCWRGRVRRCLRFQILPRPIRLAGLEDVIPDQRRRIAWRF